MERKIKLFIISGKARHGKSTVSDIIVNYYNSIGKKAIEIAYGKYIKDYAINISDWDGTSNNKPRDLLQMIGTEIIRNQVDSEYFPRRILEDIKIYSFFVDVIVISDARFLNEIEGPRSIYKDAISINVFNPNIKTDLNINQQSHLSEVSLEDYNKYDYKVINDGSFLELQNKIIEIIKEEENEY